MANIKNENENLIPNFKFQNCMRGRVEVSVINPVSHLRLSENHRNTPKSVFPRFSSFSDFGVFLLFSESQRCDTGFITDARVRV